MNRVQRKKVKPWKPALRKKSRLALGIIEREGPLSTREFAAIVWPETFRRASVTGRRGNCVVRGAIGTRRAGRWLRYMEAQGWIASGAPVQYPLDSAYRLPLRYDLTSFGRRELHAAEARARLYGRRE